MLRVLYVDDEPEMLDLGRSFLERSGRLIIDITTSAEEALERASLEKYDAVISDYQMPGMDGIALLREVRAQYRDLPFILFTGRGREEVVIEAIDCGVDYYVQKGGDPRALFAELEHRILQAIESQMSKRALLESERKFKTMVETSPDMLWEIDTRGVFTYMSPQIRDVLGYPAGEMVGRTIFSLLVPASVPAVREILLSHLENGSAIETFEVPAHHADGTLHSIEIRSAKIRDGTGTTAGFRGIARDITERKKAEEELRESEASYHGLFNTIQQGIFILNRQGRFLTVNDGAVALYGHPRDAFIGKDPAFLSAPGMNDLRRFLDLSRKAFQGEPQRMELWGVRRNGEVFPKDIRFYRGTYFGEEVLICTSMDITQQRRAADATRLSHTLLEIANRPLDSPTLLQEYLHVIRGYCGCEVVGIHLFGLAGMDSCRLWCGGVGEEPSIVDEQVVAAVVAGTTDPTEPFFTNGGSFFCTTATTLPVGLCVGDYPSVAIIPLRNGDQTIGLVTLADRREQPVLRTRVEVLEGVTPQMIGAIQRVAAEDRIRRSLDEKEVLMKEIHHRVKNNLAVIISLITLQAGDITDEQTLQLLRDLQGRVTSMALIHELLYSSDDLSQIDFGQYLQTLVPRLVQSLGDATPVSVQYRIEPALLPLEIAVPCGLIVNELVTNSLKYAFPRGRPADPEASDGCRICVTFIEREDGFLLSVKDNGVGLPDGFDWRTSRTLGLQLVRSLASHQLRGSIEKEAGGGARFTLVIPRQ